MGLLCGQPLPASTMREPQRAYLAHQLPLLTLGSALSLQAMAPPSGQERTHLSENTDLVCPGRHVYSHPSQIKTVVLRAREHQRLENHPVWFWKEFAKDSPAIRGEIREHQTQQGRGYL